MRSGEYCKKRPPDLQTILTVQVTCRRKVGPPKISNFSSHLPFSQLSNHSPTRNTFLICINLIDPRTKIPIHIIAAQTLSYQVERKEGREKEKKKKDAHHPLLHLRLEPRRPSNSSSFFTTSRNNNNNNIKNNSLYHCSFHSTSPPSSSPPTTTKT